MAAPRSQTYRHRWLAGAAWLGLASAAAQGAAEPTRAPAAKPVPVGVPAGVAPDPAGEPGAPPKTSHPPQLPAGFAAAPLVRQAQSYSCGPAALASVLRYFQVWDGPETQLYQPLGTSPAQGTLPEKLAEVAQTFGLSARVQQPLTVAALREARHAHKLVILELQAWPTPGAPPVPWTSRWDDGHYVVLIALDDQYAYFMDPSTADGYTYLELAELVPRWHDVNESRPEPLLRHDYQLGVVIGKPGLAQPVAPGTALLRPLRKLE